MTKTTTSVDHASLKSNQGLIIIFLVLAFIFDLPYLAVFVAIVMLAGTILSLPGFSPVYKWFLLPSGLVKPEILTDNPEPHRFAQGFGAAVLVAASILLFLSYPTAGWILVWLVIALAVLNVVVGFCVGCAFYYWFNKLRIPGFSKSPLPGIFPGMKPK